MFGLGRLAIETELLLKMGIGLLESLCRASDSGGEASEGLCLAGVQTLFTLRAWRRTRSRSERDKLAISASILSAHPRSSSLLKLDSRGLRMPSRLRYLGAMSSRLIDAGMVGFSE